MRWFFQAKHETNVAPLSDQQATTVVKPAASANAQPANAALPHGRRRLFGVAGLVRSSLRCWPSGVRTWMQRRRMGHLAVAPAEPLPSKPREPTGHTASRPAATVAMVSMAQAPAIMLSLAAVPVITRAGDQHEQCRSLWGK